MFSVFNQSSRLLMSKNITKINASPISTLKSSIRSFHHAKPVARVASFNHQNSYKSFKSSLPLLFGSAASVIYLHANSHTIFNDVATQGSPAGSQIHTNATYRFKEPEPVHSRFGGALNYEELAIGSITGLFLGIIAGKLSSAIVFLSLSSYFLLQFLESRNIVSIPWNSIVNLGSKKINVKELLLHKPSFKASFILTFLIAAYNI